MYSKINVMKRDREARPYECNSFSTYHNYVNTTIYIGTYIIILYFFLGAVVDKAMVQLIEEGKVKVGTKLVLHGSELIGSTSPCHPLQVLSCFNEAYANVISVYDCSTLFHIFTALTATLLKGMTTAKVSSVILFL